MDIRGISFRNEWEDSLICPTCGGKFTVDSGSLFCPICKISVAREGRHLDFSSFVSTHSSAQAEVVGAAYRFYSLLYAPLALLNMLFVWKGRIISLVDFYGRSLREASGPVLDVAIGDGALTSTVLRKYVVEKPIVGLDISSNMLEKAKTNLGKFENVSTLLADACSIPFADKAFSKICCFGGLHVISAPQKALGEMARVLTADGSFHASILLDPGGKFAKELVRKYVELGFLSNIFSTKSVKSLFHSAGLKIVSWQKNGFMLLVTAEKMKNT